LDPVIVLSPYVPQKRGRIVLLPTKERFGRRIFVSLASETTGNETNRQTPDRPDPEQPVPSEPCDC